MDGVVISSHAKLYTETCLTLSSTHVRVRVWVRVNYFAVIVMPWPMCAVGVTVRVSGRVDFRAIITMPWPMMIRVTLSIDRLGHALYATLGMELGSNV